MNEPTGKPNVIDYPESRPNRVVFPITEEEHLALASDDLIFKVVGYGKMSIRSYTGGQDVSVEREFAKVARLTIEAIRARPSV
jgi:hypothetical protein